MTLRDSRIGPHARHDAIQRLSSELLDVLVIGGGVVGCGSALDAASRGLAVGLVEMRDLASGTSSRSSKLIHGGLRYLEHLQFGLVREALRERGLLVDRLAPHLVTPLPFLLPLRHRRERPYMAAGLTLYDAMAGRSSLGRHGHVPAARLQERAPGLRRGIPGAMSFWDAQVDDARHTLAVARTAAAHGAVVTTRTEALSWATVDGIAQAQIRDHETGQTFVVRARQVVVSAGVWAPALLEGAGVKLRVSKGVHLVVPRSAIDLQDAVISRAGSSVLFLIPFSDRWIVGTTDTPWELDASHPAATAHDIDTLLTSANQLLSRPLARSDVVGVYAGLRPLIQAGSSTSARLSREHVVRRTDLVTTVVAGGKYTTYRVMARDAVDTAVAGLATGGQRSRTHLLPLVGAEGFPAAWAGRAVAAAAAGISPGAMERLLRRHGSEYREVLAHAAGRPDLLSPIKGAAEYLRAEVVHAVTCEGARHLDDVLTRRTRISISERSRGTAVATEVADLMAPLLGWDEAQCGAEIAQYRKRVQAELYAAQHPDDAGADAARTASSWRWSTKA